jgi:hypothetical protein
MSETISGGAFERLPARFAHASYNFVFTLPPRPLCELRRASHKQDLMWRLRQINPSGKSPEFPVQPFAQKYSA